jgi:hypothetical protein
MGMNKTTYHKSRNLRLRTKLIGDEIETQWVNWIVDEADRKDILQIAATLRRIYARKVVACARFENPSPPSPLPQGAKGETDRL